MKLKPVAGRSRDVPQDGRLGIGVIDDHVEPAIAIEIADCQTAPTPGCGQAAVGSCPDPFKLAVTKISKQQCLLRIAGSPLMLVNRGVNMAVSHHQIQPAVIVKIQKARSPTQKRERNLSEPRQKSYVGEISIAVIVTEYVRVVRKVCDVKTDSSGIIIIADGDSHSRLFSAILVQGHAGRIAHLFESSVALIDIEKLWRGIVDYDQIQPVIFICMHERRREAVVFLRIVDPGLHAGIFKCAIRFLVIECVALSGETSWSTHHRGAAKLTEVLSGAARLAGIFRARRQIIQIDVQIAWDKKIEPAVPIIIAPGGSRAPTLARDPDFFCHVRKSSIAVVMIEPRDTKVADEKIQPAIVIVIAYRHAHSPTLVGDARFVGHVFKFPVSQIVIKRGTRRFFFSLKRWNGGTVDQIYVRQTVPVVTKDRYAPGWHFKNVILGRRAGVMPEVGHRGFSGCVFETDRCFWIDNAGGSF